MTDAPAYDFDPTEPEDSVVRRYIGLVVTVCRRNFGVPHPVKDSEEFSVGLVGLLNAIRTFDPAKVTDPSNPNAFRNYAIGGIRNRIGHLHRRAWAKCRGGTDTHPSTPAARIKTCSLDKLTSRFKEGGAFGHGRDNSWEVADPRAPDPAEQVCGPDVNVSAALPPAAALLSRVDARLVDMLNRRLVLNQTLQEVADHFGLTRERVRQLCNQAVARMRRLAGLPTDGKVPWRRLVGRAYRGGSFPKRRLR